MFDRETWTKMHLHHYFWNWHHVKRQVPGIVIGNDKPDLHQHATHCLAQHWTMPVTKMVNHRQHCGFHSSQAKPTVQLWTCADKFIQYQVSKLEVLYILSESTDQQHILPLYIVWAGYSCKTSSRSRFVFYFNYKLFGKYSWRCMFAQVPVKIGIGQIKNLNIAKNNYSPSYPIPQTE